MPFFLIYNDSCKNRYVSRHVLVLARCVFYAACVCEWLFVIETDLLCMKETNKVVEVHYFLHDAITAGGKKTRKWSQTRFGSVQKLEETKFRSIINDTVSARNDP